jgi:hypothetical protein
MMETDLISEMKCRNCKYLCEQYGQYCCKNKPNGIVILNSDGTKKENEYEKTSLDNSCSDYDRAEITALRKSYEEIKELLRFYTDMKDENYDIIALWIMGTYCHKEFLTYPYLFFNAMKGSGKTRVLKIIKELSANGDMLASLSEAVLFRTTGTLCIDEFENIRSKEKNALRELLNTAYKKGGKVKRMKKKKTPEGDEQVVEEFSTFRPIAMANISGMEEVLGDRCISLILEKSSNKALTRKVENFDTNLYFQSVKSKLKNVVTCSVVSLGGVYDDWNKYITYIYTLTTLTTFNYTNYMNLYEKIEKTGIDGRNLELFFPLIILAQEIGVVDRILELMQKITTERNVDEIMESKDIRLFDFISTQNGKDWFRVKEITTLFRQFIGESDDEDPWLNPKWIGRALKRLSLIIQKRRTEEGIEVILDVEKAKEKLQMFK